MKRNVQYHGLIELDGGLVTGAVEMDALLKSFLPLLLRGASCFSPPPLDFSVPPWCLSLVR